VFEAFYDPLGSWSRFTMQLLIAFGAQSLNQRRFARTSNDFSCRVRHSHDLFRHAVGFLLKAVAWLVDGELGLHGYGAQQMLHHLIARPLAPFGLGGSAGAREPADRRSGWLAAFR